MGHTNAKLLSIRKKLHSRTRWSEPPIRRTVRLNIKGRRLELGLSQTRLGEDAGALTQSWVAQIEREGQDATPSLLQLELLARALQCMPADLLVPGRFKAGLAHPLPVGAAARKSS